MDGQQIAQVQALSADEWALIGRITAEGFADDPVNLWAFNGTGAMPGVYTAMARYQYMPKGFGHKTADERGGTMWLPPGADKGYGLRGSLQIGAAIMRHGGLRGMRNALDIGGTLAAKTPKEPHFYLFSIALPPDARGKGLGGALMRAGLEKVDAQHMPAYLENSKERNIPFYRQFGFEILEEIVPGKGSPPMWLMWRNAR